MRRVPFYLAILLFLAAGTLLAGCGDKSDSPTTDQSQTVEPQQADQEYDLAGTGEAAAELLGGDVTAAYALLKAFDSGYSPYQIAYAIDAGLIDESGDIEGVTPAWPSGDTVSKHDHGMRFVTASVALGGSLPDVMADTSNGTTSRSDFEQMFEEVRDQGETGRWLVWVLGATAAGYSVGQITGYLDDNEPFTDLSPPTHWGVPVVVDGEGLMVEPELPSDWPYKGRNILVSLQRELEQEGLDFEDNLTVVVIGMVNAGYSGEQIWEALKGNSIGLCSTDSDSSDPDAAYTPCYIENGEIVPPAEKTPRNPAEILVEDVIPDWPIKDTASPDRSSQLQSGEKVSLKLYPYLTGPAADTLKITSHDVVMEIEPATETTASVYSINGTWEIKLLRTETDESVNHSYNKGDRYVLKGEFYTEEHESTSLDPLRAATTYTWTFEPADENYRSGYEDRGDSEDGFRGSLDDDLEGDGFFGTGYGSVSWDTFAGVEE